MIFVVKNHFVLMQLGQQPVEQDGAMMNVRDRTNSNPTANTPQQPRVGEMAPIGIHLTPHKRGVLESEGNYIGTAIDRQRMIVEQNTVFFLFASLYRFSAQRTQFEVSFAVYEVHFVIF